MKILQISIVTIIFAGVVVSLIRTIKAGRVIRTIRMYLLILMKKINLIEPSSTHEIEKDFNDPKEIKLASLLTIGIVVLSLISAFLIYNHNPKVEYTNFSQLPVDRTINTFKFESLPSLGDIPLDTIERLAMSIIADSLLAAKKIDSLQRKKNLDSLFAEQKIKELMLENETTIFRFSGQKINFEIGKYLINGSSHMSQGCNGYLTIITDSQLTTIKGASLHIIYGNRSIPNNYFESQLKNINDVYEMVDYSIKDTVARIPSIVDSERIYKMLVLIFESSNKTNSISVRFTGLIVKNNITEFPLQGSLAWYAGQWGTAIPIQMSLVPILVKW